MISQKRLEKMNSIALLKDQFKQAPTNGREGKLHDIRQDAFDIFTRLGIPTAKQEDWKYTRVSGLFNKEYQSGSKATPSTLSGKDIFQEGILPAHEDANTIVFINGLFSTALSVIRSSQLEVMPLEVAANGIYKDLIDAHLGRSSQYIKDGINALNTAFFHGGAFVHINKGEVISLPTYIY